MYPSSGALQTLSKDIQAVYPLWIVAQVEGTGHQSNRVWEPAVTGWVNLWILPGLPPG